MSALTLLPNIGPTLLKHLNKVSIHTADDLIAIGGINAYKMITQQSKTKVSITALYALEAAVRGIKSSALSKEDKAQIKKDAGIK